jgi:hypothetical protein
MSDDNSQSKDSITEAAKAAYQQRLVSAMSAGDVPHTYFNEFQSYGGVSDMVSVLAVNERVVGVLHMSASVAKTFAIQLLSVVNQYEAAIKSPVLTLDQAFPLIQAHSKQEAPK